MKRLALVCIAVFSVSSMGCETPNLDAILDDQLPQDVVPPEGEDVDEDEEDDVDPLEDGEERSTDEDETEGEALESENEADRERDADEDEDEDEDSEEDGGEDEPEFDEADRRDEDREDDGDEQDTEMEEDVDDERSEIRSDSELRIQAIGDSHLAFNEERSTGHQVGDVLNERGIATRLENNAIGGATLGCGENGIGRDENCIPPQFAEGEWTHVLVSGGGNDFPESQWYRSRCIDQ